jgi:hypothetical protein
LLGEPQERGRLPEKIALARHSKHSWLRRKIRTKRGSYSPARHRAALLLQAPLADLERWQASSSSAKSRLKLQSTHRIQLLRYTVRRVRVSFATPFKSLMSLSFTFPAQSKPARNAVRLRRIQAFAVPIGTPSCAAISR